MKGKLGAFYVFDTNTIRKGSCRNSYNPDEAAIVISPGFIRRGRDI